MKLIDVATREKETAQRWLTGGPHLRRSSDFRDLIGEPDILELRAAATFRRHQIRLWI